ncbi:MAG: hypothetical protein RLZ97_1406 [Verrucomicrobiota bacterium]
MTGAGGRLGKALADRLSLRHEVTALSRQDWDLSSADTISRVLGLDFDILLHPAAMASLEACEAEPELAMRVNRDAPVALAEGCGRMGRRMLFFSTDYVLEGTAEGLKDESAEVRPLSVYARSKAEAELGVLSAGGAVMRVSWLFGPEKAAFPDAVVAKALSGQPLAAVADKTSLPGFTGDLAEWVEALLEIGLPNRILHAANPGEPTSWHDMAVEVVGFLHECGRIGEIPAVERHLLAGMPGFVAGRPRHTAMDTSALAGLLGRPLRPWREALRGYLRDFHGLRR